MISFPPEIYKQESAGDSNPAIRLFGRRFSDDQQTPQRRPLHSPDATGARNRRASPTSRRRD